MPDAPRGSIPGLGVVINGRVGLVAIELVVSSTGVVTVVDALSGSSGTLESDVTLGEGAI